MTPELTFVIGTRIGYYTAEPVIRAVLARHARVHVACSGDIRSLIERDLPQVTNSLIPLELLQEQHRLLQRLHRLTTLLTVDRKSSPIYGLSIGMREKARGRASRMLHLLARATPSWKPADVNAGLDRLFSSRLSNPFPSRRVVVVSMTNVPHLLCARDQERITLVESWDHPTKQPAGYVTHKVIAWNQDLVNDWTRFQGPAEGIVGYPLKLRYALVNDWGSKGTTPRVAMYAAATSSLTPYPGWFYEECQLIEEVCEATRRAGWRLLIKPKPNGRVGDFDDFQQRFPHVTIGAYRDARNTTDYYLDAEYNRVRFSELAACDLLINWGTTFVLDAAAAGTPILQLDLRESLKYSHLAEDFANRHLQYLICKRKHVLAVQPGVLLTEALARSLAARDDGSVLFSRQLRRWITPRASLAEGVNAIVDALLTE
jgi:hypothetical protein